MQRVYIILILILLQPLTISHACQGGTIYDRVYIVSLKDTTFTLHDGTTDSYLQKYYNTAITFEKKKTLSLNTDTFSEYQEQLPIKISRQDVNDSRSIQSIDLFLQLQLPMYAQGFMKAYQHVTRIQMSEHIDLPYQTRIRVHGNKPFRVIAVIRFKNGKTAKLTTADIPLRNCHTDTYQFVRDNHPLAGQSLPMDTIDDNIIR